MRAWALLLALLGLALCPSDARANVSPAFQSRAEQLLSQLAGPGDEDQFFSPVFLNAVPVAQWRALTADLRAKNGRPMALGAVNQTSPTAGQVEIRYEKATVGFTLVVAPDQPHNVVGLHIVGVTLSSDTMEALKSDVAALPGRTAFAMARLSDDPPDWVENVGGDRQMAIGSSFKLYILAEIARAAAAGERTWSDVLSLGPKSFSGRLLQWPDHAPMTLHSLATAMISESDNSATDTLMAALGRDKVDAMVAYSGHADPQASLPLLTTAEAFALKMPGNAPLAKRYAQGTAARRKAILRDYATELTARDVDVGSVAEKPAAIDQIEWFASCHDMIALLDLLRRQGGEALPVMAVNPGIPPADARRWRYLGYKGGSEPGVIAMNFLAQAQDGTWYAISGIWNNAAEQVDNGRFVALMTRALNLLSRGAAPVH